MASCAQTRTVGGVANVVVINATPPQTCTTFVLMSSAEYKDYQLMQSKFDAVASAPDFASVSPATAAEFWGYGVGIVLACYLIALKFGVVLSMVKR